MPRLTTEIYKNSLLKEAKRFATMHKVDPDDVLSYLHEKINNTIIKFDPDRGIPFQNYLAYNARLLCLNFLRDDASPIQIERRKNYLPIEEQRLIKKFPNLANAPPDVIAARLGCSTEEYLEAKEAARIKFPTSLDQCPHELSDLSADKSEEDLTDEIKYLSGLSESDKSALRKFSEGKDLGERALAKVKKHLKVLTKMRGLDFFKDL